MSPWGAEEAMLEEIKQFIDLGRPTSLEISPAAATFYLLYENPSSSSEVIASKLISAFVKNPSPATRQRYLKKVRDIRTFAQSPIWLHDYLVTQSGRKPEEWKEEFRQFILSRPDLTVDETGMRFLTAAGRVWFIYCVERLAHDPSACRLTNTTPPIWVFSKTNQEQMYRSLTITLIVSLSRRAASNTDEHTVFQQFTEQVPGGDEEPWIACRKRPCEIYVDEGDLFIESHNDNLSPMAESLILSPFYNPPAGEAKRAKSSVELPSTPPPLTRTTPQIEFRSEPRRGRGRPRKIFP